MTIIKVQYNIEYSLNVKVRFEPPRKTNTIVQYISCTGILNHTALVHIDMLNVAKSTKHLNVRKTKTRRQPALCVKKIIQQIIKDL